MRPFLKLKSIVLPWHVATGIKPCFVCNVASLLSRLLVCRVTLLILDLMLTTTLVLWFRRRSARITPRLLMVNASLRPRLLATLLSHDECRVKVLLSIALATKPAAFETLMLQALVTVAVEMSRSIKLRKLP